jgi:DNA-binding HxlR family transcriptional regulator
VNSISLLGSEASNTLEDKIYRRVQEKTLDKIADGIVNRQWTFNHTPRRNRKSSPCSRPKAITKRGTLEILIPFCCTTDPVRYIKFRNSMKGFSSKTLAIRLKQLERNEILERKAYNEIPPRVEYRLTDKGQELVESIVDLLQWMRKWALSNSNSK